MWSFLMSRQKNHAKRSSPHPAAALIAAHRLNIEVLEKRDLLAAFDLTAYEKNLDFNLSDPGDGAQNLSGIAYSDVSGTLFIIDNDLDLYEYSIDGDLLNTIDLVGFNDPEAITHLGGSSYAIVEERNIGSPPEKHISLVTITGATSSIVKSSSTQIVLEGPDELFEGGANEGIEGIAYDSENEYFYIVKEQNEKRIFRFTDEGGEAEEVVVSGLTGGTGVVEDFSDLYFEDGHLHILSDNSRK